MYRALSGDAMVELIRMSVASCENQQYVKVIFHAG